MPDPAHALTLQFLAWVAERPRTYAQAMDAWRSTCPRLSIWEDAILDGLVAFSGGATRNAARALGLGDEVGTLEAGKRCDLAIWDIEQPAELVYRMGLNPLRARVWSGR